jgi:hypothetical protein
MAEAALPSGLGSVSSLGRASPRFMRHLDAELRA